MSIMECDEIIPIEPKREKFFGGPGRMLLPCPATIGNLVAQTPTGQLVTTATLKKILADRFDVRGVCPVTFRKSLEALAGTDVPYWRVVKPGGVLIARFPEQAERLRTEGLTIEAGRLSRETLAERKAERD